MCWFHLLCWVAWIKQLLHDIPIFWVVLHDNSYDCYIMFLIFLQNLGFNESMDSFNRAAFKYLILLKAKPSQSGHASGTPVPEKPIMLMKARDDGPKPGTPPETAAQSVPGPPKVEKEGQRPTQPVYQIQNRGMGASASSSVVDRESLMIFNIQATVHQEKMEKTIISLWIILINDFQLWLASLNFSPQRRWSIVLS